VSPKKKRSVNRPATGNAKSEETRPRTWYWFRHEKVGRERGREEFERLPIKEQAELAVKIERFLNGQSRLKDVDSLGDHILEIRHRTGSNHFRVLFTLWGPHCVGLTSFYKNQQETPKPDKDRAIKRRKRWIELFGEKPPKN